MANVVLWVHFFHVADEKEMIAYLLFAWLWQNQESSIIYTDQPLQAVYLRYIHPGVPLLSSSSFDPSFLQVQGNPRPDLYFIGCVLAAQLWPPVANVFPVASRQHLRAEPSERKSGC